MSSRPILVPNNFTPLIPGVTITGMGGYTSHPTIIQMLAGISYDISWTGTLAGTFIVQVSNTFQQNNDGSVKAIGNWTTLPTTSFTGTYPVATGSPGNGFLDVVGTEAYAIRIGYVGATGTGTLTVVAAGKVL